MALGYWSVGYAFAYGAAYGAGDLISWFFQFAFAATAATIVAGTIAERASEINRKLTDVVNSSTRMFAVYLAYSLALTGLVYPVFVRYVWSSPGYLSNFKQEESDYLAARMIDFAGSGVVHMTGGATALIAAIILHPRLGRFNSEGDNEALSFPPHSVALQVLGTFILWFGWYGFNPGSTLSFNPGSTLVMDSSTLGCIIEILALSANQGSYLFDLVTFLFFGRATYNDVLANPVYKSEELLDYMSEVFDETANMFMEVEA